MKGYLILDGSEIKFIMSYTKPDNYLCDAPKYPRPYPSGGEIYCSHIDCLDIVDVIVDESEPDVTVKEAKIRFDKLMLKKVDQWRRERNGKKD